MLAEKTISQLKEGEIFREETTGIGHFQSIKTDVWLNFLKTTDTIKIG